MRTAVLLCGFPRIYKMTFPFIKKYLLDVLTPDVFFYGYGNTPNVIEQEFLDLYQFKDYVMRDYTSQVNDEIWQAYGTRDISAQHHSTPNPAQILSQYYNMWQVNELKKKHETEQKYDLVIRTRPDVFYFKSIDEDLIKAALNGGLVIPDTWDFGGVTDSFAMSTSENMDKYTELFHDMRRYNLEEGCQFHPETMIGWHIKDKKLDRICCEWFYTYHEYDVTGQRPVGEEISCINRRSLSQEGIIEV